MRFEVNKIYHIYNQGNNRESIFFQGRNYIYFIRKMREELLPYVDFLAYCLMPNHFHWLVVVKEAGCELSTRLQQQSKLKLSGQTTPSRMSST